MIVLRFHRSLYPPSAVEAAAAAYGELATIALEARDQDTTVTLSGIDADFANQADEFADSFANHVLFEAIAARRGAA